jgi:Spy/CpxP family protein refolding chaperone
MLKRSLFVLALVTAPALGCAATVSSEPAPAAQGATTVAPVATTAHGAVKFFGDALGDVPLTASQRAAVEQLASDADARHAQTRAARADLMTTVAAQVEAGQIDRTALQPKLDALTAAMQASQPADRAAFEQLHAILTPDQRTAFVGAVQSRVSARVGQAHGKHGLHPWAADLNLSDDQKAQIKAAMMQRFQAAGHEGRFDGAGAKHDGEQVMQAFTQDRFVMNEVAPPHDVGRMVSKGSEHILGLAEVALPILTPQQRTLAAQKLREKAASADEEGPGLE